MSDDPTPDQTGGEATSGGSSRKKLRPLLLAVLAVLVVLLVIDFVSQSKFESAVAIMEGMLPEDSEVGQDFRGCPQRDEVQQALGREPVGELIDKGDYMLEIYRWRRGLPWRTSEIYAAYTPGNLHLLQSWATSEEALAIPSLDPPAGGEDATPE